MFELLHALSHTVSALGAAFAAVAIVAATLFAFRRRLLVGAAVLVVPAALTLLLAVDLDAMTDIPNLMRPVALDRAGAERYPMVTQQSVVWPRRVCLGFQFLPGLPEGEASIDADARLLFESPAGALLAERPFPRGAWRETFSVRGDGGGLCIDAPGRFTVGLDVTRGDACFGDGTTRLVLAVPRHYIVCPERLRGAALAAAIPLLLGVGGATLANRRRRRTSARRDA